MGRQCGESFDAAFLAKSRRVLARGNLPVAGLSSRSHNHPKSSNDDYIGAISGERSCNIGNWPLTSSICEEVDIADVGESAWGA